MVEKPGQADQVESDSHDAADASGSVYVFKGAVLMPGHYSMVVDEDGTVSCTLEDIKSG